MRKAGCWQKDEAVVVDPRSDWPTFAEKAKELIVKDKVVAVFGCWTSVSRKSVLPVFKEYNNLLFYPVQYEGEESERNVIYPGAASNQQAIPAVDYLIDEEKVQRWVLAGTDYVYPRTANKIFGSLPQTKGGQGRGSDCSTTAFRAFNWQTNRCRYKEIRPGPARKRRWFPPSMVMPTCHSIKS